MRVLVITSGDDPHVAMVQRYLDAPVIQLDPLEFPNKTISYQWELTGFEIWYGNGLISDVRSIWFRKPRFHQANVMAVPEVYQAFAHSAYERAIKAIYSLMRSKLWISDPWAILRGNNKLYQLELASRLFQVPNTLVTSNPNDARDFLSREGRFVAKPLSTEEVYIHGQLNVMYTSRVDKNTDLSGLVIAPVIFQEEVENSCDVRVTVIGNKAFSCEIHRTGTLSSEVDWRKGIAGNSLSYVPCKIPIEDKCIELVQSMGLRFGAIDLVRDFNGNYWFMEINPNGQWGFIEEETGLPLSREMATILISHHDL